MGNKITASDLTVEQIQNGIVIYDSDTKDYADNVIEWQVLGKDQDEDNTITVQTKTLVGDGASGYGTAVGDRRYDPSKNILNSELQNWLDTTFYNHLGSGFRSEIIPVTKLITPYQSGDIASRECKLFNLSIAEVGGYTIGETTPTYYTPETGAFTYQYYQGINSIDSNSKRKHSGGSYGSWWLRSPYANDYSGKVWNVRGAGGSGSYFVQTADCGPAPACVLPSSLKLEEDANGKYKIIFSSEPVITTPSTDLGNKIAGFSFDYSITDVDASDTITANIKLDGDIVISDYTVDQTQTYTCTLSNSSFNNLTLGTHTYTITATDSTDNISTVDIVFSKVSKEEKYSSKENLVPIINKIEVKLENRYTKDEVDDLLENVGGIDSISKAQIGLLFGISNKLTLPTQKGTLTYQEDQSTWVNKEWNNLNSYNGDYIWTDDDDNIYYSNGSNQYVLNKSTSTWNSKVWNGLTTFYGDHVWTDGENIYYSGGSDNKQYVLNKSTSTWSTKTWNGQLDINTPLSGDRIWTDGDNIYFSSGSFSYVLDKETSTWNTKTWNGLSVLKVSEGLWKDGDNIYYSHDKGNYVLDKSTSTWNPKTWNGLTNFYGVWTWTNGDNIYCSNGSKQYVLDKTTSTWNIKAWNGISNFYGWYIWTDGDNIYYSDYDDQYILTSEGLSQTPVWNYYDSEQLIISGDISGTNAGTYTATFTPKNGYVWNDETTISKDAAWTINKANGDIILSSDSVELSDDNPSVEVTFSGNTGTVFVTSADRSVATASVNGNTITIALPLPKDTWVSKTWNGLTSFAGDKVWTDGDDVYYSDGSNQYILDHSESISAGEEIADTWNIKEWNGLNPYDGHYVWTDGDNIYYSQPGDSTYILDKSTSTWSRKTWNGFSSIKGHEVWTDGDNIYYSSEDKQYILDKSTSTWNSKTWNGMTSFDGEYIWTDGENIYYSKNSNQYILDKSTSTWNKKTWNEHTPIYGLYIWIDGNDIYYSDGNYNFVLNKTTSTWNSKTWNGIDNNNYLIARNIWTDGNDIYYSNGSVQYVLS